ncbi:MAG: substrate-binding domain-containing protein [Acetobacteraceae bacterium]|nr:substrate-binding domain-containing protein [Acetobacteraceae bacterium]
MTSLRVLSAGAAKGLVGSVAPEVEGVFSAVGAIREIFEGGALCDVLILTARQLEELAASGRVRPETVAPIGTVRTAVAVLSGSPVPPIATGNDLAAALRAASAVFIPDPHKSTAGIHVRRVIDALGLADAVAPKLRAFANGETAMRTLAEEAPAGGIGLTQTTEILYTKGLTLVGPLPPEHDLSTVYAACVSATATSPEASRLVQLLTGPASAALRERSGFEAVERHP